ncbi:MAG: hypothetical protein QOG98_3480, partial [Pseudonocardiales bacterium]|nr:hypothetical protein [Pseudonocardiales bacterium]
MLTRGEAVPTEDIEPSESETA